MRQASSRILAIGLCGFLACNSTLAVTLQSSPEPSSLDVALESTTVQVDEVETAVSIYTGATQQTLHGTLNMSVRAVTDASGIELTGFDVVFHMLDVESQDVTASITLVTSTRLRVEADYGSMGSLTSEFDTETHALSILSSTVDSEAIVETPMYGAALEMEKTSVNGAMTQITLLPAAQLQSLMLTGAFLTSVFLPASGAHTVTPESGYQDCQIPVLNQAACNDCCAMPQTFRCA